MEYANVSLIVNPFSDGEAKSRTKSRS